MRLAWRLFACSTILVTGCSVTSIATKAPAPAPDPTPLTNNSSISGTVHGGQFAIIGARVYLLAVNATGYGQPSTSLIDGSKTGHTDTLGGYVLTNGSGIFSIPNGDYTCSSGQYVYLYSRGGNPQQGITDNESASLLELLGDCANLGTVGFIQMNEITTISTAYALAGFATDATDIASSSTNATGLKNAVANAQNLASYGGVAQATGDAKGVTLQQTIISLANILSACINSTSGNNSCTNLFGYVKSGGTTGSTATETATEAIYIAHNPGTNVGTPTTGLFSLIPSTPAFMSGLSSAPNDWTLAITWNELGGTTGVAIDASGNVWMTNDNANVITERSPTGQNLSGASGFTGGGALSSPTGIAIDSASPSNIWVTNVNSSTLTRIVSTSPNSGTTISGNGLANSLEVAIDGSGNIWASNVGGPSVSKFAGTSPYTGLGSFNGDTGAGTQFLGPEGIALDPSLTSNNVWVANAGYLDNTPPTWGTSIVKLNNSGAPYTSSGGYTGGGLEGPTHLALDHSGNVWVANFGGFSGNNGSLSEFTNSGGPITGSNGITGGGVSGTYGGPYGIAIDGDGKVWTSNLGPGQNSNTGSISAYNPSTSSFISPANGFQPGLNKPNGIAVDASGNVWVVNDGDATLTELVGAAAPVVVPIVTGVTNNTLGTRP